MYLDIDSIPMKNLVRIIAPESNVFVGDKMLFTCIYEKFQIAREAKFAVIISLNLEFVCGMH